MENCLFCKIIAGEIPASKMYEDENMVIFKDIDPKAKNHYLCVPKSHFKLLADMDEKQSEMLKKCFEKIPTLAKELGLAESNISNWKKGDNLPSVEILFKISILLEESTDYLLGLED